MYKTEPRGECIEVRGAAAHNLKNLSVHIPKRKIVAFSGPSGSGKSSLVFDTIYTEAQRQLVETFSTFARRRLPQLSRPPVESIANLSTAILIDQKPMGTTLRSTVGTATEIATYLRLLYSRFAPPFIGPSFFFSFNNPEGMCPSCHGLGQRITIDESAFLDPDKSLREGALLHPDYKVGSFFWREFMVMDVLEPDLKLRDYTPEQRRFLLHSEPVPVVKKHGGGTQMKNFEGVIRRLEKFYANKAELERAETDKDAYDRFLVYSECPDCRGRRLNPRAETPVLNGLTISEACALELTDFRTFIGSISASEAESLTSKIGKLTDHLVDAGVGYLSLNRSVATLSGGESQRVKMARQLDCDLTDLLYILDEPSAGLHALDIERVARLMRKLRDEGNSVLMVEHATELIESADWVVEIGPRAGRDGGQLLFSGTPEALRGTDTPSARAMAEREKKQTPIRRAWTDCYRIRDARIHNLKNVSVDLPKGILTCVSGVSGSGKSTLINGVFAKSHPEAVMIDQSAIGRTSRGTPASYTGAFDLMRKSLAKSMGIDAGLLSFNSKGACPTCGGAGYISLELDFLDDARTVCGDCNGLRYRDEVLERRWQGLNIAEILSLSASEATRFFRDESRIRQCFETLCEVGLEYLGIGQPLSTLSGGECQRLKLAAELRKAGNLYVMDEPTKGLHPGDVSRLLSLIHRLVEGGNSVIIIEHDLDVLWKADWIVDMGPEGGKRGGFVVASGTPETIMNCEESCTGQALRRAFGR